MSERDKEKRYEILEALKRQSESGQADGEGGESSQVLLLCWLVRWMTVALQVLVYWKKYERVEKEQRKKAEKEAEEQRRLDEEMREARRQQRKLNFLITQTELYAHFIAKKLTKDKDLSEEILKKLEDTPLQREVMPGVVVDLEHPDEYGGFF